MLFPEKVLADVGLRYAADSDLSIRRQRRGDIFLYVDQSGSIIDCQRRLGWYENLAVPPVYEDVVYSARQDTHLQARGVDTTGNLQYFYHPNWENLRDQYKFSRLIAIGKQLPRIRRTVSRLLRQNDSDKLYVLAAITRVLDRTGLRVGNPQSSLENKTYGVSTLKADHVKTNEDLLTLEFTGKGGVEIEREINDTSVARVLEDFYYRPGQLLFQYREDGDLNAVSPAQINNFISDISGIEMTAKEFRTWRASALFVKFWMKKGGNEKALSALLEEVSEYICNTPATLKNSYIHPHLIRCKKNKDFRLLNVEPRKHKGLRKAENIMMSMLSESYL